MHAPTHPQTVRAARAEFCWSSAALAYGAVGLLPSLALVGYAALSRITPLPVRLLRGDLTGSPGSGGDDPVRGMQWP